MLGSVLKDLVKSASRSPCNPRLFAHTKEPLDRFFVYQDLNNQNYQNQAIRVIETKPKRFMLLKVIDIASTPHYFKESLCLK